MIGAVIGSALLTHLAVAPEVVAAPKKPYMSTIETPYGEATAGATFRFNPMRLDPVVLTVGDNLADGFSVSVQLVTSGRDWTPHILGRGKGTKAVWETYAMGSHSAYRVRMCRHHTNTNTFSKCRVGPWIYGPDDGDGGPVWP